MTDDHLQLVLVGGSLLGLTYGLVAQWGRFCLVRGLYNHWHKGDNGLAASFMLAMACALLFTQLLARLAGLDLSASHYQPAQLALPSLFLGGLLFGIGMALANACGARALILLGSGNLRSLVVLLTLAVSASMTLSGVLAPLRLWLQGLLTLNLPSSSLDGLALHAGLPATLATPLLTLLLALPLLLIALGQSALRQQPRYWISAVLIGLLVSLGWAITGILGADDFDPVRLASLTFVAPVASSLQYLMLSTGTRLDFAVVVIAGVLLGSLLRASLAGEFRWQGYQHLGQLGRSLSGGLLMGFGGVLALGCTLGQGLTGFSTLALSSLAALLGIIAGAKIGFRWSI